MSLSIKVPTATLIANAEKARTKIIKDHEKAVAEYEASQKKLAAQAAQVLRSAAIRASHGDLSGITTSSSWGGGRGHVATLVVDAPKLKQKSKPGTTAQTGKVDQDLKFLRATDQTHITVRAGNGFEQYI